MKIWWYFNNTRVFIYFCAQKIYIYNQTKLKVIKNNYPNKNNKWNIMQFKVKSTITTRGLFCLLLEIKYGPKRPPLGKMKDRHRSRNRRLSRSARCLNKRFHKNKQFVFCFFALFCKTRLLFLAHGQKMHLIYYFFHSVGSSGCHIHGIKMLP